jgi:hypothetical protein
LTRCIDELRATLGETKAEPAMGDIEALATVVDAVRMYGVSAEGLAEHILASDWLKQHDARLRAKEAAAENGPTADAVAGETTSEGEG